MKIVFTAPRYHTNSLFLVKAFQDKGHQVEFFSLYRGKSESDLVLTPIVLRYSRLSLFINRIFNPQGGKIIKNTFDLKYGYPPLFKFFRMLLKSKPDVVIVKNFESVYSAAALVFGKLIGSKVVIMLQIPKFRPQLKSGSVALLKFLGVDVITPVLGDPAYPNENNNLHYVPFASESPDFDKSYVPEGVIRILCVGKFQERKNQFSLVQAVETLLKKYPIHLTLIGVDDEKIYTDKLLAYIKEHDLSSKVTVRMNIPWEHMMDIFKAHDVFVLPSYNESAAVVILEAMVNKLAVLSSNANGTHCYIQPGKNGYSFDPHSVADLTKKLEAVIAEKDTIIRMGQESFAIARKDHSLDVFYDSFMAIIKKK